MLCRASASDLLESVMSSRVEVRHPNLETLLPAGTFMHLQSLAHLAAEYSLPCLEVLLSQTGAAYRATEAQLEQRDHQGKTPLHLAAANATSEAASNIIGVNVLGIRETDIEGNTPLHIACKSGQ
jgi:hypothetical protein